MTADEISKIKLHRSLLFIFLAEKQFLNPENAQKGYGTSLFREPRAEHCLQEALPGWRGGSHVACLNFKTSRVSVYKCLSLIVGFAVTVAIWPRVEGGCLL